MNSFSHNRNRAPPVMKLRPLDATHQMNGMYYKQGFRDMWFFWFDSDDEWRRSTRGDEEIYREVKEL